MADPEHLGGGLGFDGNGFVPWLWNRLHGMFGPRQLLDVGCGMGRAAAHFLELGVDAYGVDGSLETALVAVIPQERFIIHDFTLGRMPKHGTYDLIWCCELVEHVEEQFVGNIIDTLDRASVVAMTHGLPGQGGHHHVNCQPPEYWIEKMERAGYFLDDAATEFSKVYPTEVIPADVVERSWWGRSGMIFRRRFLKPWRV